MKGRMFQSLLCWIMVCKRASNPGRMCLEVGFNPCYVGLWSVRQAETAGNGERTGVSILVMLDYGL